MMTLKRGCVIRNDDDVDEDPVSHKSWMYLWLKYICILGGCNLHFEIDTEIVNHTIRLLVE